MHTQAFWWSRDFVQVFLNVEQDLLLVCVANGKLLQFTSAFIKEAVCVDELATAAGLTVWLEPYGRQVTVGFSRLAAHPFRLHQNGAVTDLTAPGASSEGIELLSSPLNKHTFPFPWSTRSTRNEPVLRPRFVLQAHSGDL